MTKFVGFFVAGLLVAVGANGVVAADDVTGLWTGEVTGITEGATKLSSEAGVRGQKLTVTEREGVSTFAQPVAVRIDQQEGKLIAGEWSSGQAGFPFVCAMTEEGQMLCADETGYVSGTISGVTMDFCYAQAGTGSNDGGKVSACGKLTRQ